MPNPNRHDFLPSDFRERVNELRLSGTRASHAYEIASREYGFNTYAALRHHYSRG
jgi:hypothetical protein